MNRKGDTQRLFTLGISLSSNISIHYGKKEKGGY